MLHRLLSQFKIRTYREWVELLTHLCEVFQIHMVRCRAYTHEDQSSVTEVHDLIISVSAIVLDPTYAQGD